MHQALGLSLNQINRLKCMWMSVRGRRMRIARLHHETKQRRGWGSGNLAMSRLRTE
uniref:Uncharacterized protein n=1 Tax=Arundo donax TaxID=35708 RepID=A0A0A8YAL6_ARUDO